MKKTIILSALALLGFMAAKAQLKVGPPAGAPDASAMLQIESTNKGLRLPQVALTTTTTFGLAAPTSAPAALGMTVYNTTAGITSSNPLYPAAGIGTYTWDGTGWAPANSAAAIAALTTSQDLRAVGSGFLNHLTKDAGVGSNGTSAGTGAANIAMGTSSLASNTSGGNNVAIAINALGQNTTGSNNVGIGPGAGGQNKTASDNIAIGNNALYNNTGANGGNVAIGGLALNQNTGAGASNTAVGYVALNGNTSGGNNVGVGAFSLYHNTTGNTNVALGGGSLQELITGTGNTAAGHGALNQVKGGENTGVGLIAGFNLASGSQNTAVGTAALSGATGGNLNTAVGYGAISGNASTTGSNNVGLGVQTLNALTTGNTNTAVGNQAGINITSASNNVVVGNGAGVNITTGSNNTTLGWSAGNAITTGSQNIAIGYQAQVASPTGTNQMSIGGAIYGTGISTSTPKIAIGSGATTPRAELDIQSSSFYGLIVSPDVTSGLGGGGFVGSAPTNGVAISQIGHLDIQSDVSSATATGYALLNLGRIGTSVNGDIFVNFNRGSGNVGRITQNGTTGVLYQTTSDERLKENIRPTAFSLADVLKIDVRDYNYKSETSRPQTGFVAQQLYTVYPNAVTPGGDDPKTNPWMVDYGKVTPLLVKAIQDQQTEITAKDAKISTLETRLEKVEKIVAALQK